MTDRIVVIGGNGFIGSEVCRIALLRGLDVVSVARRGRPTSAAEWTNDVQWIAADVFAPESWCSHLHGATAAISCVGIAWQQPRRGITFERLNGDATIVAAQQAVQAGVEAFVFISASHNPPLFDRSYLTAKRRAEQFIQHRPLRATILRPSLVYGPQRPISLPIGLAMNVVATMHLPFMDAYMHTNRALRVERVAAVAVQATIDPNLQGIIDIDSIEALTSRRR